MSRAEMYYLALVLASFTAFGVTLAVQSWLDGKYSRQE